MNLPRDKNTGKTKGFGFLMYEDQRSTVLAVDNLNGAKVLDRTLRVDHVKDYKQSKVKGEDGEMVEREEQSLNAKPEMIVGVWPYDCSHYDNLDVGPQTTMRTQILTSLKGLTSTQRTLCMITCCRNGKRRRLQRRPPPKARRNARMRHQKNDGLVRKRRSRRSSRNKQESPKVYGGWKISSTSWRGWDGSDQDVSGVHPVNEGDSRGAGIRAMHEKTATIGIGTTRPTGEAVHHHALLATVLRDAGLGRHLEARIEIMTTRVDLCESMTLHPHAGEIASSRSLCIVI